MQKRKVKHKDYNNDDMVVIDEEDNPLEEYTQSKEKNEIDPDEPPRKTWSSIVRDCLLLIWDGLPFFGFKLYKL